MVKPVDIAVAKDHFDHLLEGVSKDGVQYAIQAGQETVAVLIPPTDFEAIHQQQQLKEQAWRDLERLVQRVHARHVHIPPDEVAQDVEEAIREVRQCRRQ